MAPRSHNRQASSVTRTPALSSAGASSPAILTVLVIDPDEKYTQQLSALAEETDVRIEFRHAPDFKKAAHLLTDRAPDAIVLGLQGDALYEAIHGLKPAGGNYPVAPVVVLARDVGADGGLRAVEAGAQDVLAKATDIHLLARALRFAVERHRLVRDFCAAEVMARKIKHILSDLVAHSRDGIMIVSESGSVHLANENALRLMGNDASRLENVPMPIDPARLKLLSGVTGAAGSGKGHSPVDIHLAATRWGDDRSTIVFLREK